MNPSIRNCLSSAIVLAFVSLTCNSVYANHAMTIKKQRTDFLIALEHADAGQLEPLLPYLETLQDFPLYPYLYGRYLLNQFTEVPQQAIDKYLNNHAELSITQTLQKKRLRWLAKEKKWAEYLRHYRGEKSTTLLCLFFQAQLEVEPKSFDHRSALELWQIPNDHPSVCDPAFEALEANKLISYELRRKRFEAALSKRHFGLARHLAQTLKRKHRTRAARWTKMNESAKKMLLDLPRLPNNADSRAMIHYGINRLARKEPITALNIWPDLAKKFHLPEKEFQDTRREIILWAARQHLPSVRDLLETIPNSYETTLVRQWRIRLALRELDWAGVLKAINALPPTEAEEEAWRYWRARALANLGQMEKAVNQFKNVAKNRSYYGFLAADRLDQPYSFGIDYGIEDPDILEKLAHQQELILARELFSVDMLPEAREAWGQALKSMTPKEKTQTALLAKRWGWYSQAIISAARYGLMNDLDTRYPFPYRTLVEFYARQHELNPMWVYGLIRSESLFQSDAGSRVGAQGLMQLMPTTAESIKDQLPTPLSGPLSLHDPTTNVALGTHYLDRLRARFNEHLVLSTAAYNAGPGRVNQWMPLQTLPADVWADTVPFLETRTYIQRVFSATVIFHWRKHGHLVRLNELMPPVKPA